MITVQVLSLRGTIIEDARWHIQENSVSIAVGHPMSICIYTKDKNLLAYIGKNGGDECSIGEEKGKSFILVKFIVKNLGHMLDESKLETLCTVSPASKMAEQVMLWVLCPTACDHRYADVFQKG